MGVTVWRIPVDDDLLYYVEEHGHGSPALVFLHYWGGSRRTWAPVIDTLAEHYRCAAIDLRGWGDTDRTADDYSLTRQADDVAQIIAAIGLREYVLVGHSMGGKIAQILAGREPEGLRGVVLVAPAPPTPLHVPEEQKQRMLWQYSSPEGVAEALTILTNRRLDDAQRRQVTEDTLAGAEAAKLAWPSEGMELDISQSAAAIRAPVNVIVGSADQVEPECELREAILPLIPHARFEILEGVGHLSPLEAPGSLAEAILDILAV